jgi:hypothetical protein
MALRRLSHRPHTIAQIYWSRAAISTLVPAGPASLRPFVDGPSHQSGAASLQLHEGISPKNGEWLLAANSAANIRCAISIA